MSADRHLHVTDAGPAGVFEVNTFRRVLSHLRRPIRSLPQVVHLRRGRPLVGVVISDRRDLVGRRQVEVITPALGPDGPYVDLVGLPPAELLPVGEPLPEATEFLGALAAYAGDPSDANWAAANDALASWGQAMERRPLHRAALGPVQGG